MHANDVPLTKLVISTDDAFAPSIDCTDEPVHQVGVDDACHLLRCGSRVDECIWKHGPLDVVEKRVSSATG